MQVLLRLPHLLHVNQVLKEHAIVILDSLQTEHFDVVLEFIFRVVIDCTDPALSVEELIHSLTVELAFISDYSCAYFSLLLSSDLISTRIQQDFNLVCLVLEEIRAEQCLPCDICLL